MVENKSKGVAVEYIGKSAIAFDRDYVLYVREYYLYCVSLLRKALLSSGGAINLRMSNGPVVFGNGNKVYRIALQYEHTLVKQGGRDSQGAPVGEVLAADGSAYLVRVENYASYEWKDFVIDYSMPNIINMRSHQAFADYSEKVAHVAPLLYPFDPGDVAGRHRSIVTTFNNENEPRRRKLLDALTALGLPYSNEKGHFDHEQVVSLYRGTRILVNIHQTDHHHTLEELRILPALLCGCVIVSEDVPLKEHVPYSEFIVWADYESIAEKVRDVHENYDFYFQKIFGGPRLAEIIQKMEVENALACQRLIEGVEGSRAKMVRRQPIRFAVHQLRRWAIDTGRLLRNRWLRRGSVH